MRGIPRKAVEQNLPISGSKFTAAQAVLPESDTNRTCVWNRDMFGVDATTEAGRAWYASIARQYADWGVDYIKCDDIANLQRGKFYDAAEIEALSTSLKNSGRSIVLSLSPGATPVNAGPHVKQFANLWRISGDFWDNWPSLDHNFGLFAAQGEDARRDADRGGRDRLRVQGAGEHGPEPSRPRGVPAHELRHVPARHEALARAFGQ